MDNPYYNIGAKYGFGWDVDHSRQVIKLGQQLYREIVATGLLARSSGRDMQVIEDAGFVHDIGRSSKAIGVGEHNNKSVTTLKKELGPMACAEEHNQLVLYCVHHHRGEGWKEASADKEVSPNLLQQAKKLCGIFRVADALDHGLQRRVDRVSLTLDGLKLICKIFPTSAQVISSIDSDEKKQAEKKSDLMSESYGLKEVSFELAK